jgi:hypothetical protein
MKRLVIIAIVLIVSNIAFGQTVYQHTVNFQTEKYKDSVFNNTQVVLLFDDINVFIVRENVSTGKKTVIMSAIIHDLDFGRDNSTIYVDHSEGGITVYLHVNGQYTIESVRCGTMVEYKGSVKLNLWN